MFPYLIRRENIHGVDETAALSPTLMHRPIVIYRQHLIEGQWPTYNWWYHRLWYDGLGWRQISGCPSASSVPLSPKSMWPLSPHQYCASVNWFLQDLLCVQKASSEPHKVDFIITKTSQPATRHPNKSESRPVQQLLQWTLCTNTCMSCSSNGNHMSFCCIRLVGSHPCWSNLFKSCVCHSLWSSQGGPECASLCTNNFHNIFHVSFFSKHVM